MAWRVTAMVGRCAAVGIKTSAKDVLLHESLRRKSVRTKRYRQADDFLYQIRRMPVRRLINRRSFIAGAAGLAVLRPRLGQATTSYPFTLGVASGCPRPDRV